MPLNLYRRHGSHCVDGRALHEMTYEADELRRSWKNCSCPIYASGTLGARFKRRNTERNRWDESKTVVRAWEDAGTWDGEAKIERLPVVAAAAAPVVPDRRVTIEGAAQGSLRSFRNTRPRTHRRNTGCISARPAKVFVFRLVCNQNPADLCASCVRDGKRDAARRTGGD
jgi:hypothetical protein